MFKLEIIWLVLLLAARPSLQITVESSSFCIGSCYKCPENPYQCPFIQSLLYPPSNNNCLPYSTGEGCAGAAFGLQDAGQSGLSGWTSGGTGALQNQTCTIFHQPATTPKLISLGPFTGTTPIQKTIQVSQESIQQIILKLSFTFKSSSIFTNESSSTPLTPPPPPPPDTNPEDQPAINPDGTVDAQTGQGTIGVNNTNKITNKTSRAFVDVRVTGPGVSYVLELNYPLVPGDRSSVVNTSCGLHMQYVHAFTLNQSVAGTGTGLGLKFQVFGIGGTDAAWGLTKFEVYLGCGGLMIPSGASRCGACMSGYYPIMAQEGVLQGCAPCPSACKTCTQDRCTLCYSTSTLNPTTNKCQLITTYSNLTSYKVLQGISLADPSPSPAPSPSYFSNLLVTDSTSNAIVLQSQLLSSSPYSAKFYLFYNGDFIKSLNQRAVVISRREEVLMSIQPEEFRTEVGVYDRRFPALGSKYYVKSIYIDRLNQDNNLRTVEISVRAPPGSQPLYISNYQLIQYQCAPRCSQCDRDTNTCLQCSGFFVNRGPLACIVCANGYFIRRNYTNPTPSPSQNTTNQTTPTLSPTPLHWDSCIKCHSSCKQCIGPQLDQCSECYKLFYLDSVTYNRDCIQCIYNARNNPADPVPEGCRLCLSSFPAEVVFGNVDCSGCVRDRVYGDVMVGEVCQACWIANGLASGRCIPTPASGLTFYGSDVSNGIVDEKSWAADRPLKTMTCTNDYKSLWGIANIDPTSPSTLRYSQKNLPPHTGLHLFLDIFKTDIQFLTTPNGTRRPQNLFIRIQNGINETLELINKRNGLNVVPGSNICEGEQNQMIHTYSYDAPKHNGSSFGLEIVGEGGGVFVRQLEMYLGNCNQCAKSQLNYEVKYLPRYSYNDTVSSGIDVWIDFNKNVKIPNNTNLKDAFKFQISELPNLKLQTIEFKNQLQLNNRLKYYIPLDTSFKNGTLKIRTSPDSRIFGINPQPQLSQSRRLLINSPLNILQSEQLIHRFSKLSLDDLVSTNQLYWFYNFFQWFALITMIVCVFFGVGVVFQEFSILLQLLFLHVYISSSQLPATYKAPLAGLERMENLNYFAVPHAQNIEWQWFKDYEHPSPQVFQQYNKDILFERSFYPTIIINLIYLCWFIIMFVIYKCVPKFRGSPNYCLGFLRNIPARPLNFIDQIWRYQFITTMWSAFMQFHILKNDTAWERLNLALCFISFIISIIWPFFVVCYTYRLNSIKYSTDFMYKYQDIYYKKMQTISESKIKYYYYIFIRFIRYFIMALFICVFTEHQIIAPVILICVNIIEIVYVVGMRIYYNSILGTVFKVAENLLFIGVEIALLFVYGLSDTAREGDFLNLGYAINVLYVIMIILGLLRVAYLVYQKIKHYRYNMEQGVETGEVVNVGPTPLPNTDRGEPVNNVFA